MPRHTSAVVSTDWWDASGHYSYGKSDDLLVKIRQLRGLLAGWMRPAPYLMRQFSWLEYEPVTLGVTGSNPVRIAIFI